MFILFDERVQPLLIKHLGLRHENLMEMKYAYVDAMQKLQTNETLVFIEEQNLTEEGNHLDQLCDMDVPREQQLDNLEAIFTYIVELTVKYPELNKRIESKVREMNRAMVEELFSALPEEAIDEIAAMFVDDMKSILEIADIHDNFQLPERLKKFRQPAS